MPPVLINLRKTSTGYKVFSDKEKLTSEPSKKNKNSI